MNRLFYLVGLSGFLSVGALADDCSTSWVDIFNSCPTPIYLKDNSGHFPTLSSPQKIAADTGGVTYNLDRGGLQVGGDSSGTFTAYMNCTQNPSSYTDCTSNATIEYSYQDVHGQSICQAGGYVSVPSTGSEFVDASTETNYAPTTGAINLFFCGGGV